MDETLARIHRDTIAVYQRQARGWDRHRLRIFCEQGWLDRFIALLPDDGRVLDLGCGAGDPIAGYLLQRGLQVTGVDAAPAMLNIASSRYPEADWRHADMRTLQLDTVFDGIISWDGFFHLNPDEQRRTLPILAAHTASAGALLLTIGHEAGEVTGVVEGETVYHASLSVNEYRSILDELGFDIVAIALEDMACDWHSVLLAQRRRTHREREDTA